MSEPLHLEKCTKHPEADAIHVNLATNDHLCIGCAIGLRRSAIQNAEPGGKPMPSSVGLRFIQALNLGKNARAARLCFQVMAGVVPGSALPEFTEEWWLDSDTYHALLNRADMTPDHPENLFTRARDEAHWYAKQLTDPSMVNWVRVEFIYF
jgi:hypothetical protein